MVTRRKRWSSNAGSLRRSRKVAVWWSKSREEPRRAQAASPRQSRSNPNFGEIGSTQFLEQGLRPALFLFCSRYFTPLFLNLIARGRRDEIKQSDPAELRARRRGAARIQRNPSIVTFAGLGTSIYGRGVMQISASLDGAFFAANLQFERIRAPERRRGRISEISTLPESDRTMQRGSK